MVWSSCSRTTRIKRRIKLVGSRNTIETSRAKENVCNTSPNKILTLTVKVIHLSAILEHPTISTLKPEATQILLQQALKEHPSDSLELSQNGYYIRRRPSTYPLRFIPQNSFEMVDDHGLGFWDQRTIYVEPHTRDLCKTPARVAYWLKEHGHMKEKWLPIQAVHTLYNSCALVVLSGNVTHQDVWEKWRGLEQPEEWKILTKVEHTKRTDEYVRLQRKERGDKATAPVIEASKKRQIVDMDTSEKSDISRTPSIRKPTRRETNEAEARQGGRQGH
jgi:hypothetical protein